MRATISYALRNIPHPWNDKQRANGVKAWCLVKVVKPELGNETWETVAIFNLDSEAETFAGLVHADGHGLVDIGPDFAELFKLRAGRR